MGRPTPVPPSDEEKSALVERIIRGELTPEQAQQRHGLTRAELKEWVRVYRREARRAFDDRVKSVLSHQGIDIGDLAGAEFSGSVEDMSLAELLQTIQLGGKDAEIRIEHGRDKSHLWCIAGQVVDAESSELRGAAAVYRMLSFQHGRIHADFSPVQRPRRIDASTPALLMEGARRFDECCQLRSMIGDMDAVLVPSDRSLAPDVQATQEQFAVLRAFDGFRSVEDVVKVSQFADLETLTSILALHERGLLERVRSSRTSLRRIPITFVANEPAPESSFLPLAQSLVHPRPPRPRRWVWAVAAIGSATLGAAMALRFADERTARAIAAAARGLPTAGPGAGASRASPSGAGPRPGDRALDHAGRERAAARPAAGLAMCPEGSVLLARSAGAEVASPAPPGSALPRAVAPFCMARTEVTVADYERCLELGACSATSGSDPPEAQLSPALRRRALEAYTGQCNAGQAGRERHPMNCVTFGQASAYCAAAGGRLPTEAEWELAARGDEGRPYPWGDAPPSAARLNACGLECKAWYAEARLDSLFEGISYDGDDGFAATAPVASYPSGATRDGIHDLLGNVAEWTSTIVELGQAPLTTSDAGTYVVRGGSFSSGGDGDGGPTLRVYLGAEARARGVGFRCAYEPR